MTSGRRCSRSRVVVLGFHLVLAYSSRLSAETEPLLSHAADDPSSELCVAKQPPGDRRASASHAAEAVVEVANSFEGVGCATGSTITAEFCRHGAGRQRSLVERYGSAVEGRRP